jgi:hypothetical protein
MLRPVFKNIILFFFLKYILFYFFLMFKNNDYTLIEISSLRNGEDVFYYLWIFLFLPVLCSILFSVPTYFAFKLTNLIYFLLLISGVLIAEYFLYTYFASQADLMNGVYNGVISLLVLLLMFFKPIGLIFEQKA